MIELKNVSKVYPNGTVALDKVNLRINDGEFVFVVGASGAGKSTLMKLLLREETASEGDIFVDEMCIRDSPTGANPGANEDGTINTDFEDKTGE